MSLPIAVTQPEFDKAPRVFAAAAAGTACHPAPPEEAALAAFLQERGIAHVIVGIESYAADLYQALPPGAVLARFGVGYDNIALARATASGILCTNTPGALDASVAELTIGLILAAARQIPGLHESTAAGRWEPQLGTELLGKRLAVIGCGPIGCRVARIASFGLGMEVVGCEIRSTDLVILRAEHGFHSVVRNFGEAVAGADYVSIHIPSTPATEGFLDAERIAALPQTTWLVNTSRGAVVDDEALFDALAAGRIAGAALDVHSHEPYAPSRPDRDMRSLPNVILTPHVGSSTVEACQRMARTCLDNIAAAAKGRYAEMNLLNPEVLGHLTT